MCIILSNLLSGLTFHILLTKNNTFESKFTQLCVYKVFYVEIIARLFLPRIFSASMYREKLNFTQTLQLLLAH